MDVMTGDFGSRLRSLRTARNLSQSALGGSRYTAGYISHLESGRRQPTSEVVSYLAAELDVPREQLDPPEDAQVGIAQVLDLELKLSQSWRDHDLRAVGAIAEELAELARSHDRVDVWWRASLDRARALALADETEEASSLLASLREHELTRQSRSIAAEALNLTSTVLFWSGQLSAAHHAALEALAVTSTMPVGASRRIRAMAALTHVLATIGDTTEAVRTSHRLTDEAEHAGSLMVRGIAYWVAGEALLGAGDVTRGLDLLDQADQLVSPDVDAYTWGRFLRSTAMRLALAGESERLVQRLRLCASAPPARAADTMAMEHIAASIARSDGTSAGGAELASWAGEECSGPSHLRGEALLAAVQMAPSSELALDWTREAEALFRQAGAPWRALVAVDAGRGLGSS